MTGAPVLDAHALMVYLEREDGFARVKHALTAALSQDESLPMTVVNAGEVLYIVRRERGADKAAETETIIRSLPISLIDVDLALTREAARLKAGGGLSYADCFAAALARQLQRPLLTGDPEFQSVAGEIQIEWLTATR
jgi:predicted nucleic acid-binding protein